MLVSSCIKKSKGKDELRNKDISHRPIELEQAENVLELHEGRGDDVRNKQDRSKGEKTAQKLPKK